MNAPRLTLVTITKNDPEGLARTIGSATALREAGAEHLVIDGGVDPESSSKRIYSCEPNLKVHVRSPQGVADAFNAGLAAANGEWIWFINGGDAIHETLDAGWLFSLLQKTRADVITGALEYDGDSKVRVAPPIWRQWPPVICWIPHPSTLVRKAALKGVGGFDPHWSICTDYDLWYRLLSRPITVDVLAVPFARFDMNGMSQRAETRKIVQRENAGVLWRHKAIILSSFSRSLRGLLFAIRGCVRGIISS